MYIVEELLIVRWYTLLLFKNRSGNKTNDKNGGLHYIVIEGPGVDFCVGYNN